MKHYNKLWLLALPLAFTACQNELDEVVIPSSDTMFTLKCSVDESPITRAQVQIGNSDKSQEYFMWNDNDEISVFNLSDTTVEAKPFYIAPATNSFDWDYKSSADFCSPEVIANGSEIAAIYPNVSSAPLAGNLIGLEIPDYGNTLINGNNSASDYWRNYMKSRLFMYASSEVKEGSAELHFKQLCAMARITYMNCSGQDIRLNTVGLVTDAPYFASKIALDMTTGEVEPVTVNNTASVTFDNGGKTLSTGQSIDLYLLFFPGQNFAEGGTLQFFNGMDNNTPTMETAKISAANDGAAGFEAGKRYWFNVVQTDSCLAWTKEVDKAIDFEDEVFEQFLVSNFDSNNDGKISVFEAASVTRINCNAGSYWDSELGKQIGLGEITSLKGIEYFTNLRYLYFGFNHISSIDLSQNTKLEVLECFGNEITNLDLSKNTELRRINCGQNQLTELDVTNCTKLEYIGCYSNQLLVLDLTKSAELRSIECENNQFTNLDVTNCAKLEYLWCNSNQLTALDLSNLAELREINCGENLLTNLDVTNCEKIERLYCNNQQISDLNLSNCTALTRLECTNNQLTKLDLTNCTKLEYIRCNSNQLTVLDLGNLAELREIYCTNNQLTELNVTNCEKLERLYCYNNQLTVLDLSKCEELNTINCNNNQLNILDVSNNLKLSTLWAHNNPLKEVIVSPEQDTSNFHYTIYDFNGSGNGENADPMDDEFK